MAKETFIMVSLDEHRSKELAQVISNETSRKILDYLGSKEDVSEGDISKELNLPVSTVHYNVQHLLKVGLIESKEFKWSEKGKKVDLYNVARKLIVIAPRGSSESFMEKLKGIMPAALVAVLGSAAIYSYQKFGSAFTVEAADAGSEMMLKSAAPMMEAAPARMMDSAEVFGQNFAVSEPNYALWFLLGSLFALFVMLMYQYLRKAKK
ncbi:MAG: helix-turn-helix domain-containing protein [Candidatus Woesearchaeota archaeon]